MTCPCNPKTGPEFDPDREGVSEADMARFGCEDGEYFFEDELDPYSTKSSTKPWVPVVAAVALGAFLLVVLL